MIEDTYKDVANKFGSSPKDLTSWLAINHHLNPATGATPANAPLTSHILSKWLEVHPRQRQDSFNARRVLEGAGVHPEIVPHLSSFLPRVHAGEVQPSHFIPRSPLDLAVSRLARVAAGDGTMREPDAGSVEGALSRSRGGVLPRVPEWVGGPNRSGGGGGGINYSQAAKRQAAAQRAAGMVAGLKAAVQRKFEEYGAGKFNRSGQSLKLAQYDAALPLTAVLKRISASNYTTFLDHMRQVLAQSGVIPHEVSPAIHDVNGQARASIFAAGSYRNPNAPATASAWTGLLGRQPGMLSFTSNPQGQDSIYKFDHGDADQIQQALGRVGVTSRVIVPHGKTFTTYVYDQGRQKREAVSQAVGQLGVPVDEWRGVGTPVAGKGGDQKDMGRDKYRGVINQVESGSTV